MPYQIYTRVSFQHPFRGLVHGEIVEFYYAPDNSRLTTQPNGLVYVIEVICPNRGAIRFVKQPCDISLI
jgi:hypothetical protein